VRTINSLYQKYIVVLFDSYRDLDHMIEQINSTNLRPERALLVDMFGRAEEIALRCDIIPLPRSVTPAARNVGDCAYLLAELCKPYLKYKKTDEIVSVDDSYDKYDERWDKDTTVKIKKKAFQEVLDYQAKAYESLKYPGQRYNLTVEKVLPDTLEEASNSD
jgi:hypothetical protein